MKVYCVFSLESPQWGDSNDNTQYTISQYIKNHPKLSQVCNYGIFFKGPKNEFEWSVVNEPSVFEHWSSTVVYSRLSMSLALISQITLLLQRTYFDTFLVLYTSAHVISNYRVKVLILCTSSEIALYLYKISWINFKRFFWDVERTWNVIFWTSTFKCDLAIVEICLLHHRLDKANIWAKFQNNFQGVKNMERTRKVNGRTDGRTDGRTWFDPSSTGV